MGNPLSWALLCPHFPSFVYWHAFLGFGSFFQGQEPISYSPSSFHPVFSANCKLSFKSIKFIFSRVSNKHAGSVFSLIGFNIFNSFQANNFKITLLLDGPGPIPQFNTLHYSGFSPAHKAMFQSASSTILRITCFFFFCFVFFWNHVQVIWNLSFWYLNNGSIV